MITTWTGFSLLAALFWSFGINFTKAGLKQVSSLWTNIIGNFFRALIWIPLVLYLSNWTITWPDSLSIFILVVVGVCFMSLYYSLNKGKASLVMAFAGMSPLVTTVWSLTVTHTKLFITQYLGMAFILLGVGFVSGLKINQLRQMDWVKWGLLSMVLIGTGDFLTKLSSIRIGAYQNLFWLSVIMQFLSFVNFIIDRNGRTLPKLSTKNLLPTFIGQLIMWTGSLAYFLAIGFGNVSVVAAIGGSYIAGVALVGKFLFKEWLTSKQYVGIGLCTVGVAVLSV